MDSARSTFDKSRFPVWVDGNGGESGQHDSCSKGMLSSRCRACKGQIFKRLTSGTLRLSSYLTWTFFTVTWTLLIILVMRDWMRPWDCAESPGWMWESTWITPQQTFHLFAILDCVREGVLHFLAVLALLLGPSARLPRHWHSFEETEQQEDIHLLLESQLVDYLGSSNEGTTEICPNDLTFKRSSKGSSTYRVSVTPSRTSTGSWNLSRAPFLSFRLRRVSWPVYMWEIRSSGLGDERLPCPIP